MRVIVAGCGRTGSALAARLAVEGHEVRVIDPDPATEARLPHGFRGRFLRGSGFARAVLEDAGTSRADAYVAVTATDNANIVSARVAREDYGVPSVIARVRESSRNDLHQELGIPALSDVRWMVHRVHQALLHRHLTPDAVFGSGETLLVRAGIPRWLEGRPVSAFDVDGEIRVVELTRAGRSMVPAHSTPVREGDDISCVVASTALRRLSDFIGKELGT